MNFKGNKENVRDTRAVLRELTPEESLQVSGGVIIPIIIAVGAVVTVVGLATARTVGPALAAKAAAILYVYDTAQKIDELKNANP